MNPDLLTEALHEEAALTRVGPPPLDDIHQRASRRHQLTALVVAAAVMVMAATGVAVWERVGADAPPPTDGDVVETDRPPPPGTRHVGLGHVVVAVPDDWTRRLTDVCGPDRQDDQVRFHPPTCTIRNQSGVTIYRDRLNDTDGWVEYDLDGLTAVRSDVSVHELKAGELFYSGRVYIPDLNVVVAATATDDPGLVAELLERVAVLRHGAAVPGYREVNRAFEAAAGSLPRGHPRSAFELYREVLDELGIESRVVQVPSHRRAGWISKVEPERGEVVPRGSVVTVSVSSGDAGGSR